MDETPQPRRAKIVLVFLLVLLPLAITAVFKYAPVFTKHQEITSVAILHPHLIGPAEYLYLEDDVAKRLHEALPDIPTKDIQPAGSELAELMNRAGTSALIVPTLTVDAGIVQLNLQVIEAGTNKVIFNTPYQSSLDNYPKMMKAAGAALKRSILG
jgi:hypothetical protein